MLLLALLPVCGCASNRNTEILEARLREQEDRLREVQSQLGDARSELKTARSEATVLRTQLTDRGRSPLLPEQARNLYSLAGIELSKLLTGSLDRDGRPGDELLAAVVVPHDEQGSLVKVPGRFEFELLDLSTPKDAHRIGRWEFDTDETRGHWHQGLFGSGYSFHLPWQQIPKSSKLLLHARLTTTDGRQFDTSRQIVVNPSRLIVEAPVTRPPLTIHDNAASAHQSHARPQFPAKRQPRRIATTHGVEIGRRNAAASRATEPLADVDNDDHSADRALGPSIPTQPEKDQQSSPK
jgi:hypothetical protein